MTRALRLCLVTLAAASACFGTSARAQTPVIEIGREADVQALFSPHALGDEVEGWTFDSIAIESTYIDAVLRRESAEATLRLEHLDELNGEEVSPSFAMTRRGSTAARSALDLLSRAVQANDQGGFWRAYAEPLALRLPGVGAVDWVVVGGLFALVLLLLAWRLCEHRALLALIVLVGAGLRLFLAPRTLLGAWFYSRTTPLQSALESSPLVRYANNMFGATWSEVDLFGGLDFAFALITPVAVFLHARLLLGSERRALLAAGLIALLPAHIRFSMSEVAFIPSIVFSSTLFVCMHGVLRAKRPLALFAALGLAAMTVATLYARPLNVLFVLLALLYVVLIATSSSRTRRAMVAAIVTVVATPIVLGDFLEQYGGNVQDGARLQVLVDGFLLVFDAEKNTLINARMTPWPFLFFVLATLVVAIKSARGNAEDERPFPRRVLPFILAWLALFFFTHAYVIPAAPAMQARYHLHLAVPVVFLAALGAEQLWLRSEPAALVLGLATLFSPLTHRDFIEDIRFNELQELTFVREVSQQIPTGCALVEYAPTELDARFRRGGIVMKNGEMTLPYSFYVVTPDRTIGEPNESCVYVYEGLTCWANKEPSEEIAPLCRGIQESHRMEVFQTTSYESRVYDGNLAMGFSPGMQRIQLTLYRAR